MTLGGVVLHAVQLSASVPEVDGTNAALLIVLAISGVVSAVLVALAMIAFSRRRSRSYLLITAALGALTIKALLGGLWLVQFLPSPEHHLLEHGMDSAIALLLIGAIYFARGGSVTPGSDKSQ